MSSPGTQPAATHTRWHYVSEEWGDDSNRRNISDAIKLCSPVIKLQEISGGSTKTPHLLLKKKKNNTRRLCKIKY